MNIKKILLAGLFALASGGAGAVLPTYTIGNLVVQGTNQIPVNGITGATSATVNGKLAAQVNLQDYAPSGQVVCNGSGNAANDTTAYNAFITAWGTTPVSLIIPCASFVNANITFAANTELNFTGPGSISGVAGTEVITVAGPIKASQHQIFKNSAPISTLAQNVQAAWFGAATTATDNSGAINLALDFLQNVGGVVDVPPGNYNLTAPISHFHKYETLKGAGSQATNFTTNGTNINGIQVVGTPTTALAEPNLLGFNLTNSSAGTSNTGITLQYTALARLQDIQVTNYFYGIYMQRATNSFFYRMGAAYTLTTNGFVGWYIDGGGTSNVCGNCSSTWRDTYVQGSAVYGGPTGQIGYRASGAFVNDLYFDNAATAETNYGYYFDYTGATSGGYADVILQNPVIDGFTAQGIFVNAMPVGQMFTVLGGWIDPVSVLAETDSIYINNAAGSVNIDNVQFSCQANYAYDVGVRVIGSTGVRVRGSTMNDCHFGIKESGSGYSVYSGNYFYATSAHAASQHISITGGARTWVTGNSFDGYATNGVIADNTSSGVGVIANIFNAGTVSAPRISNSATTPIGSSDGSTGLNSGY